MISELNNPDTTIGIALSIILTTLVIISKSPAMLKLIDGGVTKIMCIPTMIKIIHLKLRQDVNVVKEIDKQDSNAVLGKLGIPDEVVRCLYEIAPGENGTIDRDVMDTLIQTINIIITNKNKNLQPLEMKKP